MSGLDALRQQNNRGKGGGRPVPPPRHKPREAPVELAAPTVEAESAQSAPPTAPTTPPTAPTTSPTAPATPPKKERAAAPTATKSQSEPDVVATASADKKPAKVAPSTIYFDHESDDWLERACAIGRQGRPKVDSRSGFVRLAVRLLAESMSPEEAVAELRRNAGSSTSHTGRPRL